jgi:hypothetical protein
MVNVLSGRRPVAIAAFIALLASLIVVSRAEATTYYACVKKKSGSIRLVRRTTKCRKSEKKISFNSRGLAGRTGANGKNGANGLNGAPGAPGTFSTALSSGQTIRGAYNTGGTAAAAGALANTSISFLSLLSSAPTVVIVREKESPPTECPGSVSLPQAKPGFLCIYEEERLNTEGGLKLNTTLRVGATIFIMAKEAGGFYSVGTWALTAA